MNATKKEYGNHSYEIQFGNKQQILNQDWYGSLQI